MISIFLIDDDPIYLTLARKIISSADERYQITEFMKADEAIDFLAENQKNPDFLPNFIFVDLSMPVMDGWSFLDQYEKLRGGMSKAIDLYIVTSSISLEDIDRSKNYDAVKDFYIKPIGVQKMRELATNL
jgi:two-component system, chemotaxis family, chemotaxis protein CheY